MFYKFFSQNKTNICVKIIIITFIFIILFIRASCPPDIIPKNPIPKLSVFPSSLDFGSNQNSKVLNITNPSDETKLIWNVLCDQNWVKLQPISGETTDEADAVAVSINREIVSDGEHTANIQISSNVGTKTITLFLRKNQPPPGAQPHLSIFPTNIDFGAIENIKTIYISNTGGATLNWNTSLNQSWMNVTPLNGNTTTESDQLSISINRDNIVDGKYNGSILINSNGGSGAVNIVMEKSSILTNITKAYVKLYDDENFTDRALTIKYPNNVKDMHNVKSDDGKSGFNDKTTSVKWYLPIGWQVILYDDDNYRDSQFPLIGTGKLEVIYHLGSFSDKTSSLKWEERN